MAVRYALLHLMPDYMKRLDALVRQTPGLRYKMTNILKKYGQDCSLLQRSPLNGAKKKVFHVRVDGEKRLIDEPLERPRTSECAILMIDHHEEANKFGEFYASDTMAIIDRGKATTILTRPSTPGRPKDRPPRQPGPRIKLMGTYGELLKQRPLIRLGLTESQAVQVLAQSTEVGLESLGLPPDICMKIDNLFQARLSIPPLALPVPGFEPIESIAVAPSQVAALLRIPLHQLLSTMTEEQQALARRKSRRLYAVRGAAGSGKTVIGIRRIEHLLAQRDLFDQRPILFTCFNRVLAGVANQMIVDTIGRPTRTARVEVQTIYQILDGLAKEWNLQPQAKRLSPRQLVPIIHQIRQDGHTSHILDSWTDEEVLEEMREVIFGRGLWKSVEYLAADRAGRGRGLDERGRKALWRIYKAFRHKCDERKPAVMTWEHLAAKTMQYLEKNPRSTPRYAGIVIDEVQDLMPAAIRTLIRLQADQTDNILLLGDAAQNVFHSGFRWKDLGLNIAGGQSRTIRKAFRSTEPIVRAASPLVTVQRESLGEDLVMPEPQRDDKAPEVQLRKHPSSAEELEQIALEVAALVEEGVPPSSIGVLVDTEGRKKLVQYLDDLDCRTEDYQKQATGTKSIDVYAQSVKLLPTLSAKGLEFQYLFIPQVTEARYPSHNQSQSRHDRARRDLYTAMMRCAWSLHLSAVEGQESGLLAELEL